MNIYFAASIRGGLDDKDIYVQLISYLKKFGSVLTEHIVDPGTSAHGGSGGVETAIYSQDISWLTGSDVVVAEVTTPSLGVGYELAFAEKLHKPVLCLYRKRPGSSLSAMVAGNRYFKTYKYAVLEDAQRIIDDFLQTWNVP